MALRELTVTSDGPAFKLLHGTVTGGPFEENELLTGSTSGATARIMSIIDANTLSILIEDGGPVFTNGEVVSQIGGISAGASATLSADPDPGSVGASIEDQVFFDTDRGKVQGVDLVVGDKVSLMASDDCLYRIVSIP